MTTLILPPRYSEDSVALWRAAIGLGWKVKRLQGWQLPTIAEPSAIAIYGEPMFAAHVAAALECVLIEPPLSWLADLPAVYTRRSIQFTTLGAAQTWAEPAFIKPADDKSFPAQVYEAGSAIPVHDLLEPAVPVLISEPVRWRAEFRCFVSDRQVRTCSPYLRDGTLAQDAAGAWPMSAAERADLLQFCATLLSDADIGVPPAFVLDVGIIEGRGWAVIEANPCWAAGIYGCDPAAVLDVVRAACRQEATLSPEERCWVIER